MKDIPIFKIDEWVRDHAPRSQVMLHGSYISTLSLNKLQQLAGNQSKEIIDGDLKLTYGNVRGSVKLRERIAELHSSSNVRLTADNVVITTGSILANYLVLTSLCGPGDHVICQYPTYGQLYILPRFQGADVEMWKMRAEDDWLPSIEELEKMIRPNTKAIIINNPNNPTGTVLPEQHLKSIVAMAQKQNILLFSDEVFAPLFHGSSTAPPLVSLGYPNCVSTGSVSKAHGLPGIRIGWAVSPDRDFIERIVNARDYTTISVSQLDDGVASFALSSDILPEILERNLALCQRTIGMLDEFVKANPKRCSWTRPSGAGTAFIRVLDKAGEPVDDATFVSGLVEKFGVSIIPGGHSFSDDGEGDFKGYIRISLGDEESLKKGLPLIQQYLDQV